MCGYGRSCLHVCHSQGACWLGVLHCAVCTVARGAGSVAEVPHILVVEDQSTAAGILTSYFETHGYEVGTFYSLRRQ